MSRKQKSIKDLCSDLREARRDINTAKLDLEDTESNRLFLSLEVFQTMLSNGEIIDVTGLHCFIKGCIVTEIARVGDGIKISATSPYDDIVEIYNINDLTDEEIYYLATFLVLIAAEKSESNKDEDDEDDEDDVNDDEDDVNDDEVENDDDNDNTSTPVIRLPAVTEKTEINENVFWITVNTINWAEISKFDNSVNIARNTIISMGFSVEQIKQLRDIFIRLQNELVQEIKQEYSDQDFSKSDYKVFEISDYIIGLGDETYVNIFNGIEDVTPYIGSHPIHFLQCFS